MVPVIFCYNQIINRLAWCGEKRTDILVGGWGMAFPVSLGRVFPRKEAGRRRKLFAPLLMYGGVLPDRRIYRVIVSFYTDASGD